MKQMDATKNGSASDAELHVGETVLHMPIEKGTEGERAMDVSALLKNAGAITLDDGYANTGSTHSAITFLDGEQRHPALPRLPDRGAGRAGDFSRSPTC